jgi:hypothetical protein
MMVGMVFEEYIEVEVYIEVYIEVEVRVQAQAQEQVRIELDQEQELELGKVAALAQDMVEEQVQGHTTERNLKKHVSLFILHIILNVQGNEY